MNPARDLALDVVKKLRTAGYQALWAGGCVRDQLLGLDPHDYDVATDATPDVVRRWFPRSLAIGVSFGVIEVLGPRIAGKPLTVQVATFRKDCDYDDGRHPLRVEFSTPREDALRRDFTMNGMFFDPIAEQVIDYVGGQADLQASIVRAIGDPTARFTEDKLRMLRAVRFAARFDFTIDPATAAAVRTLAGEIKAVSAERICEEFRKMLTHARRARAMDLLWQVGLVPPLLPEWLTPADRAGAAAWECMLAMLGQLQAPSFPLALAPVLCCLPVPAEGSIEPRAMASAICLRFRMSNADRERVAWLVENRNVLRDAPRLKQSRLKPLLVHPGIRDLIALHRADALAAGRGLEAVEFCQHKLRAWTCVDLDPAPLITGNDLIARGLEPGPRFKELLDQVRDAQLEGTIRSRAEAMALVDTLLQPEK